jgi:hypothetical protein
MMTAVAMGVDEDVIFVGWQNGQVAKMSIHGDELGAMQHMHTG